MIDIVKDLPFEDCEHCECIEPEVSVNKLYGDFSLLCHEIEVYCANAKLCGKIREHLKKEAETNGADK